MSSEESAKAVENKVIRIAQEGAARIFDGFLPEERASEILTRLGTYEHIEEADKIRASEILSGIEHITDKESFIKRAIEAMKPVIDYVVTDPERYQTELREHALESGEKNVLNDLVYYHLDKQGSMHLHVFPTMFSADGQKLKLFREGLHLAAHEIEKNPEIKNISATSWIVAENPKLLTLLGFTVQGEISPELRASEFAGDPREIHNATISREDFLTRYR